MAPTPLPLPTIGPPMPIGRFFGGPEDGKFLDLPNAMPEVYFARLVDPQPVATFAADDDEIRATPVATERLVYRRANPPSGQNLWPDELLPYVFAGVYA